MENKPRIWWLDKISKDKHGWMDACPHEEGDCEEYKSHIKVVDYESYKAALDKIDKLTAEIAELKAKHAELLSYLPKVPTQPYERELAQKCVQQDKLIEKMARALEFYGEKKNWRENKNSLLLSTYHSCIDIDDSESDGLNKLGKANHVSGKRAREALAEYENFKGDKL